MRTLRVVSFPSSSTLREPREPAMVPSSGLSLRWVTPLWLACSLNPAARAMLIWINAAAHGPSPIFQEWWLVWCSVIKHK